jgi:two-component system alkaline phosphatase synthesis response regulator PhoP
VTDKKIKVLVVDDEPAVNEVIRDALELCGFEVDSAFDGEQAIAKVAAFKPDAVVLDVIMPKENGYRVSRKIKTSEHESHPKVLLLTGRRLSEYPDREAMFREFSMADDVMYKPIDMTLFVDKIRTLVTA